MITVDRTAPVWAQQMATQLNQELERLYTRQFQVFTVATKPTATDPTWAWRVAAVSDGAANKKMMFNDSVIWRYFDGAAV